MTRSRTALTAWAGISASLLALGLVAAGPWPPVQLAGALLLACVPAGAGVMCWIDSGENAAQAGLVVTLSLAASAIASAIMIWVSAWTPPVLFAFAVASVVSCAARLRREAA
jgi:hypothetical protein